MNKLDKLASGLMLASLLLFLGCGSGGSSGDQRRYFLMEVNRPDQPAPPKKEMVLLVRPFTLAPGYHATELTYRTSDLRYETDYYNQFITNVGLQFAEQTRNWLSASGQLAQVLPAGSAVSATHILEGNITKLHGDFRDKAKPEAVMRLKLFLVDVSQSKPNIVRSDSLDAQAPVEEATAESLVKAYQVCLQDILQQFENKLKI